MGLYYSLVPGCEPRLRLGARVRLDIKGELSGPRTAAAERGRVAGAAATGQEVPSGPSLCPVRSAGGLTLEEFPNSPVDPTRGGSEWPVLSHAEGSQPGDPGSPPLQPATWRPASCLRVQFIKMDYLRRQWGDLGLSCCFH